MTALAVDQAAGSGAGRTFTVEVREGLHPTIAHVGDWRTSIRSNVYGGSVRYSQDPGDAATLRFRGRNVGVVLSKRPGLGTAEVCIDPDTTRERCGEVALDSEAARPRFLAFTRNGLDPSETRKVRVTVVEGRVELDAFVVLSG